MNMNTKWGTPGQKGMRGIVFKLPKDTTIWIPLPRFGLLESMDILVFPAPHVKRIEAKIVVNRNHLVAREWLEELSTHITFQGQPIDGIDTGQVTEVMLVVTNPTKTDRNVEIRVHYALIYEGV